MPRGICKNTDTLSAKIPIPICKNAEHNIMYNNTDNNTMNNTDNNYFENKEINDLFLEYLQIRKNKKIQNTERAISILIKKIKSSPEEDRQEMIENAIVNNWQSIYPLSPKKNANTTKHSPSNQLQDCRDKDYSDTTGIEL